jgi:hypothetical protein
MRQIQHGYALSTSLQPEMRFGMFRGRYLLLGQQVPDPEFAQQQGGHQPHRSISDDCNLKAVGCLNSSELFFRWTSLPHRAPETDPPPSGAFFFF